MRICFIDASVATMAGGTESLVHAFCTELAKRHDVLLIAGRGPHGVVMPHIANAPFTVLTVPFIPRTDPRCENLRSRLRLPLRYDVEALTLFLGFLRRWSVIRAACRSDVVSFHYPSTALLFSWFLRAAGVPSVVHTAGPTGAWAYGHSACRFIIANSVDTRQRLQAAMRRTVDGTVTPGVLPPPETRRAPHTGRGVLLYVGRIARSKGVYRLLHILKHLSEDVPGARLVMVGANEEGESLAREVDRLGLTNRVEMAGEVPCGAVASFYRTADLLVHASRAESFGMVVTEALAHGVPVLASDMPSIREASGGCASFLPWLAENEWPDEMYRAWAREAARMLTDTEVRQHAVEKGAAWARTQTWDRRTGEYEVFLRRAARRET